jgi:hypothetical protein
MHVYYLKLHIITFTTKLHILHSTTCKLRFTDNISAFLQINHEIRGSYGNRILPLNKSLPWKIRTGEPPATMASFSRISTSLVPFSLSRCHMTWSVLTQLTFYTALLQQKEAISMEQIPS